jgi:hypothetical protein
MELAGTLIREFERARQAFDRGRSILSCEGELLLAVTAGMVGATVIPADPRFAGCAGDKAAED